MVEVGIVALSTSILSVLIWGWYTNDAVFSAILFAVTVYRRILSAPIIANFVILLTFAHFSEALHFWFFAFNDPALNKPFSFFVFVGIGSIFVFTEQLLRWLNDFIYRNIATNLIVENLAFTLLGYQTIYITPVLYFLAVPFLHDATYPVNGNKADICFTNQWLHIFAQYGILYLALVLLSTVVRECLSTKKEANFVFWLP